MASLKGIRVLITSGPTHEPLDPVRFIGNRSSGKQGHAIAEALKAAGAEVILVSGPVHIPDPKGVSVIKIKTAREMLSACKSVLPVDIFIGTAAVADWRPKKVSAKKMKKTGSLPPTIELIENPDILKTIGHLKQGRPKLVIGFAAETQNIEAYALQKRKSKKADWMLANNVSNSGIFDSDDTRVIWMAGTQSEEWVGSKREIAQRLTDKIGALWK